ncbi:unnamed protein product [Symbiodinium necroappetens]|uniref:EXPERA domain-containing protein n=1 Tax=Symbiodinium necroappetens TaxID=1628268 RepID=A0A812WNU9_9DINO|nr:unnamed protein product [Symbiodinium necroappetens]
MRHKRHSSEYRASGQGAHACTSIFQVLLTPIPAGIRLVPRALNRVHFDCAYALELFVEAPFAAWMMYLFLTQDHRRYLVELVALAIQFAGTVVYYIPGIMRLEHACWLSWADKACGSVWMIFPAYVFWRTLTSYRNGDSKKHT